MTLDNTVHVCELQVILLNYINIKLNARSMSSIKRTNVNLNIDIC